MFFIPVVRLDIENESDREFMERLFEKYHKLMLYKAYGIVYNYSDAEDVMSDAFAALIPHVDTLRKLVPIALKVYVMRTVTRAAYAFVRKRERGARRTINADISDLRDLASDAPDVDAGLIRECSIQELKIAMSKVTEEERELLMLRYHDLVDSKTIAAQLGISPGSVRMRFTRIRYRIMLMGKED